MVKRKTFQAPTAQGGVFEQFVLSEHKSKTPKYSFCNRPNSKLSHLRSWNASIDWSFQHYYKIILLGFFICCSDTQKNPKKTGIWRLRFWEITIFQINWLNSKDSIDSLIMKIIIVAAPLWNMAQCYMQQRHLRDRHSDEPIWALRAALCGSAWRWLIAGCGSWGASGV